MFNISSTYASFARPLRMGLCAAIVLNVGSLAAVQGMDECSSALGEGIGVTETCQTPQSRHQMFSAVGAASVGFGLAFAGLLPGSRRRKDGEEEQ